MHGGSVAFEGGLSLQEIRSRNARIYVDSIDEIARDCGVAVDVVMHYGRTCLTSLGVEERDVTTRARDVVKEDRPQRITTTSDLTGLLAGAVGGASVNVVDRSLSVSELETMFEPLSSQALNARGGLPYRCVYGMNGTGTLYRHPRSAGMFGAKVHQPRVRVVDAQGRPIWRQTILGSRPRLDECRVVHEGRLVLGAYGFTKDEKGDTVIAGGYVVASNQSGRASSECGRIVAVVCGRSFTAARLAALVIGEAGLYFSGAARARKPSMLAMRALRVRMKLAE